MVTPAKNLFHCFGCGAAGGPIDWVMKRQGVSFRHAALLLRDGAALTPSPAAPVGPVKTTTVRRLAPPVSFDADDRALLNQVVGYYHETLKQSSEALAYLAARGLVHGELIERFRLGYANRTLGLRLPEKTRKTGAEMRARLERIGVYRKSGHEHFNGSLIVPVLDETGRVQEVYGRKIRDDLRPGTPKHLYLPGPHRGVWNIEGVAGGKGEVILTEALIDALTFWCAGYRNVTAAYGTGGFTEDHLAAFRRYEVRRVLIAYDRDEAGERAAGELTARLTAEGLACYRIEFPKGMDANEYALKLTPAAKSLGVLISKAAWLGQGKAPGLTSAPIDELAAALGRGPASDEITPAPVPSPLLAAKAESAPIPEPALATPVPPAPAEDPVEATSEHELVLMQGDRRYRVRGWKKPLNPESMKVNLLVHRGERFHVDTFDLYSAKARAGFVKQAGIELGEAEDTIKHDLGRVLLKLEALQEAEIATALAKDERPALSDEERIAALDLLRAPDLMARIAADFTACGVVGKETNTLVGYLACVSRLLDRPLAIIIQSSSAAGKSSLMDAILALMPAEAQVRYSAMTEQSLFYMGETNRITYALEAQVRRDYRQDLPPLAPLPPPVANATFIDMFKGVYASRTLMLVIFNIFQTIGVYGFINWVPTLLISQGIEVTRSLGYTFIIAVAAPVGPLLGYAIADRIERKWQIVASSGCLAIFGVMFAESRSGAVLILLGILMNLAVGVLTYGVHAYQPELYPTGIRALAVGFVYSFSRISAVFSGFFIAFFLRDFGAAGVYVFIAGAMAVVMVVIATLGPRTRDRPLEEISR